MATFDERARTWDTDDRRRVAGAVAAAIRSAIELSPTMRTVEVGAGTGLLGLSLVHDIGELVLAEPSSGMLDVAREKLAILERPGTSAVAFDLLNDPPLTPPFDLAISQLVLHHIVDTGAALRAIAALLRPGGRLALSDLDTEDGRFHDEEAEGVQHLGFDRGRLRELAEDAGFAEVAFTTAHVYENERGAFPMFLLVGVLARD
jgi:SAM-dependent methyltransferase